MKSVFWLDYNICDILENHVNGKSVPEDPESGVMPSHGNRRNLADIIVTFIVDKCGRDL